MRVVLTGVGVLVLLAACGPVTQELGDNVDNDLRRRKDAGGNAEGSSSDAGGAVVDGAVDGGSNAPDAGGLPDVNSKDAAATDGDSGGGSEKLTLFGGIDGVPLGDVWQWNGAAWSPNDSVTVPHVRHDHAMASLGGKLVLFGGIGSPNGTTDFRALNDTWEWDGTRAWVMRTVPGPSARSGHRMVTFGGKIVLFGGAGDSGPPLNDTWEWDGSAWAQRNVAAPPSRTDPAMATFGGKVILFGGWANSGYLRDTWEWDGNTWTQRNVDGPPARSRHAMAPLGDKLVLFGGVYYDTTRQFGTTDLADTWEWNGVEWRQRIVSMSPVARDGHSMAAIGGRIILFGGVHYDDQLHKYEHVNETWDWNEDSWNQRASGENGPTQRIGQAMAVVP